MKRMLAVTWFCGATLVAAGGCSMCDDCHDYSPPVLNSGVVEGPVYGESSESAGNLERVVEEPTVRGRASSPSGSSNGSGSR